MVRKRPFNPDKREWRPSVLPGQIVVVSTVDENGEPNVAPKSWVTMAAFRGPMIAFGCNEEHATYRHIVSTGQFVVNVPGEPLAERIWALIEHHGQERLQRSGFTLRPAQVVKPPLIEECKAHLECELDGIRRYGKEVVIFGRVLAASIDEECLRGAPAEQYFALRPIFFLEDGTYGSIDTAKRVGQEQPTEQLLFVVEIGDPPGGHGDPRLVQKHVAHLRELWSQGRLLLAGPFADGAGGIYVIHADSQNQAEALAQGDPLVRAGASWRVRAWERRV